MRVRYAESALAELGNIIFYVAERNSAAASAMLVQIEQLIERLERFPEIGRPKYKPGVRMVPLGRYPFLVFYTIETQTVWIVSIRHIARRPRNV